MKNTQFVSKSILDQPFQTLNKLIWKDYIVNIRYVGTICLQHFVSGLLRQGEHLPINFSFFLTTLFLLILVCPYKSFILRFLRKHNVAISGFIIRVFQLLSTIFFYVWHLSTICSYEGDVCPCRLFFVL